MHMQKFRIYCNYNQFNVVGFYKYEKIACLSIIINISSSKVKPMFVKQTEKHYPHQ